MHIRGTRFIACGGIPESVEMANKCSQRGKHAEVTVEIIQNTVRLETQPGGLPASAVVGYTNSCDDTQCGIFRLTEQQLPQVVPRV